jgi:hypothetical protein
MPNLTKARDLILSANSCRRLASKFEKLKLRKKLTSLSCHHTGVAFQQKSLLPQI